MTHFSPGFITNPATGYTIENSVWFDGSADELTWTPGVDGAGAGKKFTISWWQKLLSDDVKTLMSFGANGGDALHIQYEWGANKYPNFSDGSNSTGTDPSPQYVTSNMLERDFTAWSHWVYKFDSDQPSAADRHEIFKNGVALINGAGAITWDLASVQASPGRVSRCTMQYEHNIGNLVANSDFKGFYIADFIIVDNQGLDADSFGELDSNGVWVPVDPSGLDFGTNGVWLNFADSTNVGLDVSGNTNNFASIGAAESTTIDMTQASNSQFGLTNVANVRVGTSFTLASATSISRIQVTAGRLSGDTGNCYCEIYNATGTVGTNATGTGTALAISEAQDVSTWSTASGHSGYTWTYFDFATPVTLAAGDYVFVFDSDTSNDLYFWAQTLSGQTTNLTSRDSSGVWSASTSYFQNFVMKGHSVIPAAQQVTDSPTDDAENGIGNYATFNPLGNEQGGLYGGVANLAEGNTRRSAADDNWYNAYSTIAMNTTQGGKWYAEFEYITSSATTLYAGVALKDEEVSAAWQLGSTKQKSWAVNGSNGQSYFNNSGTAGTGGALSTGDIIMVAYDADNETLYLGVNDSWFGSAEPDTSTSPTYSSVPTVSGDNVFFAAGVYGTTVDCKANFGNEAFAYTIPTGYKALSTANLPAQTAAASVTPLTSPSFTGNANADGPFVWLGYSPDQSGTSTINGNTITWGTHADALAGGMKLRTASTSYNSTGTNTISIAVDVNFEDNARAQ